MKYSGFVVLILLGWALWAAPVYESALVGYWKMDDTSGVVKDETGHFTGTLVGGVTRGVTGKYGKAYQFSSAGAYVDMGAVSSISPSTIEAWINLGSYNANGSIYKTILQINTYYKGSWSDTALYIESGHLCAYTSGSSNATVALNQWTHVAMVNDGTNISLYINGQLDKTVVTSSQWKDGWSMIRIGGGYEGDYESFYGALDEVAVFNRALSATELSQHATLGIEQYYITVVPELNVWWLMVLGITMIGRFRKRLGL